MGALGPAGEGVGVGALGPTGGSGNGSFTRQPRSGASAEGESWVSSHSVGAGHTLRGGRIHVGTLRGGLMNVFYKGAHNWTRQDGTLVEPIQLFLESMHRIRHSGILILIR